MAHRTLYNDDRLKVVRLICNPLFALEMTQHDIRASLYAPLRVLIYETDEGNICVEYDKPSSFFGQFGNERPTFHVGRRGRKFCP